MRRPSPSLESRDPLNPRSPPLLVLVLVLVRSRHRRPHLRRTSHSLPVNLTPRALELILAPPPHPQSVHLIEFPSLLLPPGVGPGSIVNIACTRNLAAEKRHARDFWDLQRDIADAFGSREPQPPQLRVRNTTQTSVTLEWDTLDLAAASLLNLSIYRNGQRLTTIPNPLSNTSTKLSGLSLDTDYAFHLVLKTSAGTYQSPTVKTRTHTIDNTTGISACFGLVEPADLADEARRVIGHLGAKSDSKIQVRLAAFLLLFFCGSPTD